MIKPSITKFQDVLAFIVLVAIIAHSYIKGIDMTETYKAVMMAIIMYYYGSSKSSSNKDETIKSLQDTASSKPTTTVKADTVNTDNVETVNTNSINTNS